MSIVRPSSHSVRAKQRSSEVTVREVQPPASEDLRVTALPAVRPNMNSCGGWRNTIEENKPGFKLQSSRKWKNVTLEYKIDDFKQMDIKTHFKTFQNQELVDVLSELHKQLQISDEIMYHTETGADEHTPTRRNKKGGYIQKAQAERWTISTIENPGKVLLRQQVLEGTIKSKFVRNTAFALLGTSILTFADFQLTGGMLFGALRDAALSAWSATSALNRSTKPQATSPITSPIHKPQAASRQITPPPMGYM